MKKLLDSGGCRGSLARALTLLMMIPAGLALPGAAWGEGEIRWDPSFGVEGRSEISSPYVGDLIANGPAGSIFVGGREANEDGEVEVVKLDETGERVVAYGNDGSARASFRFTNLDGWPEVTDLSVDRHGRVVLTGLYDDGGAVSPTRSFILRFRADGSPDRSFGLRGIKMSRSVAPIRGGDQMFTAVDSDSRMRTLAAGWGSYGRAVVVRYRADGRLDRRFGTKGRAFIPRTRAAARGNERYAESIRVLPGGAVAAVVASAGRSRLYRLTRRGTVDRSFGRGRGFVPLPAAKGRYDINLSSHIVRLAGGRLLVGLRSAGGARHPADRLHLFGRRGTPVRTFGRDGRLMLDGARLGALFAGGKTVDLGNGYDGPGGFRVVPCRNGVVVAERFDGRPVLFRLDMRGRPDRDFAAGGIFSVPEAVGVFAVDTSGRRLIVAGSEPNGRGELQTVLYGILP